MPSASPDKSNRRIFCLTDLVILKLYIFYAIADVAYLFSYKF